MRLGMTCCAKSRRACFLVYSRARPQTMDTGLLLSSRLTASIGTSFFRPLARPSAPVYVDCADRLEGGADESGQLSHSDALLLIREVLALHPRAELSIEEGANTQDLRQRASKIFNQLLEAGWIEDRRVSLDEHWVLISPALRPLLRLLRDLAEQDVAELKDFAATLRSVCATLLTDGALDPARLTADAFRQTVKELLDRVGRAIDQMHAVEKLILSFEERQRVSPSGEATLRVFYTEFYEGEHMVCYDVLQRGGLVPRLNLARAVVQDALSDPFAKDRLAEGLAAHRRIDPNDAYPEAEAMLSKLERAMASIHAKAEIIDGRIADFSRLSAERYRYQTELRGRRPEQVKAYLQAADSIHAGKSFADLANEPGMVLRCLNVEIYFGRDALSRPRKARSPVDLALPEPPGEEDAFAAQEQIRRRNRDAITPQRAGRFIEKYLAKKGTTISTAEFKLLAQEDLYDLFAVLAYERASGSTPQRPVRWRVMQSRAELGLEPDAIPCDHLAGRAVERFSIERTA